MQEIVAILSQDQAERASVVLAQHGAEDYELVAVGGLSQRQLDELHPKGWQVLAVQGSVLVVRRCEGA